MYQEQSTSSSELQTESLMAKERAKAKNLVENVSSNFIEITNAAGEFFKTPYSKTALNKFFYKLKCLEEEWYTFCLKYARIERENHCLSKECEREKFRKSYYKSRLKFMKTSEINIERLKDLYENVKALAQPETSENYSQTDYYQIKIDSLKDAKNTLNLIKEMVDRRENRYEDTGNIVQTLKLKNKELEFENVVLVKTLQEREEDLWSISEKRIEAVYKPYKCPQRKSTPPRHKYTGKARSFDCTRQQMVCKLDQRRSANCRTPTIECPRKYPEVRSPRKYPEVKSPRKYTEVKSPRKPTPYSPPRQFMKFKDRDKYQNVPKKKKKRDLGKHVSPESSRNISRVCSIHEDNDNQLKTILSIRSMLTNTVVSKVSDPSMPTTADEFSPRRKLSKGDCREIEILKKIQLEIRKKQTAIREKIERFNKIMPSY